MRASPLQLVGLSSHSHCTLGGKNDTSVLSRAWVHTPELARSLPSVQYQASSSSPSPCLIRQLYSLRSSICTSQPPYTSHSSLQSSQSREFSPDENMYLWPGWEGAQNNHSDFTALPDTPSLSTRDEPLNTLFQGGILTLAPKQLTTCLRNTNAELNLQHRCKTLFHPTLYLFMSPVYVHRDLGFVPVAVAVVYFLVLHVKVILSVQCRLMLTLFTR